MSRRLKVTVIKTVFAEFILVVPDDVKISDSVALKHAPRHLDFEEDDRTADVDPADDDDSCLQEVTFDPSR